MDVIGTLLCKLRMSGARGPVDSKKLGSGMDVIKLEEIRLSGTRGTAASEKIRVWHGRHTDFT